MKTLLTFLSVLAVSIALIAPQAAEAKRFGGGKSFGYNKQMPSQQRQQTQRQQPAQPASAAKPAAAGAAAGSSKWLGPLAGLAAGGFLAWMLFGEGFEGLQFMDILLFGLLAFVLFKIFARRRSQVASETANQNPYQAAQQYQQPEPQTSQAAAATRPGYQADSGSMIGADLSDQAQHQAAAPSWFDAERFAEDAKNHFTAVQQAWDAADASTIESYCTPELFQELAQMMAQLDPSENFTEIDTLNSLIVDQSIDGEYFIASVNFSGFIKEGRDQDAHSFNEVWHIRRLAIGDGNWQIAGIQQLS